MEANPNEVLLEAAKMALEEFLGHRDTEDYRFIIGVLKDAIKFADGGK